MIINKNVLNKILKVKNTSFTVVLHLVYLLHNVFEHYFEGIRMLYNNSLEFSSVLNL